MPHRLVPAGGDQAGLAFTGESKPLDAVRVAAEGPVDLAVVEVEDPRRAVKTGGNCEAVVGGEDHGGHTGAVAFEGSQQADRLLGQQSR